MIQRYDVAIIGTGPAGLSAAVTLKIRNKNILLLGNRNLSKKVEKAHQINNYLGLPAISGKDLCKKFQEHIDQLGIEIMEERATTIYLMGDYYGLLLSNNEMVEATTVILATGVEFGKPYPGEERLLGRGVSYCATCDAPLYRNKTVVLLGYSEKDEHEADFMSEIAETVYYIPMYEGEVSLSEKIVVIRDTPVSIEGENKVEKLVLKEQEILTDAVFILRECVAPSRLVPGLEVDENHVAVNRKMETNMKGLFACGDIVGAPYQYIKAAGEGNIAALSAVSFLAQKK